MREDKVEFIQKFQVRIKKFALSAIDIYRQLPKTEEARIIGKQFLRASLSVGQITVLLAVQDQGLNSFQNFA